MSEQPPTAGGVTPDGARYAAHLIRKRSKGDRFHPRRPETAVAMLAAADWLDQLSRCTCTRPPAILHVIGCPVVTSPNACPSCGVELDAAGSCGWCG